MTQMTLKTMDRNHQIKYPNQETREALKPPLSAFLKKIRTMNQLVAKKENGVNAKITMVKIL